MRHQKKEAIINDITMVDSQEGEGALPNNLITLRATKKEELEALLLSKEVYWRQKAKVGWAKEGDCNFRYFHRIPNRRKKKLIKSLVIRKE